MSTFGTTENDGLFEREPSNPILQAADWPYPINTVFNPGATRLADGTTLLLCRVEDRRGHSHFTIARSANGVDHWTVDPEPAMVPDPENHAEELWGIEDPRVVYLPAMGRYAITYTAYSASGPGVSLALTDDFRTFERCGMILGPEDKDAAMLPHQVGGEWLMVHRPVGHISTRLSADIWMSSSTDLRHWGERRLMLEARRGSWWDANKIGLSPPLIETPRGWLMIYHGVRITASGAIYRLGLALFDRAEPWKLLLRGDDWVFGPQEPYERQGDVPNVVFPCGYTVGDDNDTLHIYYGAADSCIALATSRVSRLLAWLDTHGQPTA